MTRVEQYNETLDRLGEWMRAATVRYNTLSVNEDFGAADDLQRGLKQSRQLLYECLRAFRDMCDNWPEAQSTENTPQKETQPCEQATTTPQV